MPFNIGLPEAIILGVMAVVVLAVLAGAVALVVLAVRGARAGRGVPAAGEEARQTGRRMPRRR